MPNGSGAQFTFYSVGDIKRRISPRLEVDFSSFGSLLMTASAWAGVTLMKIQYNYSTAVGSLRAAHKAVWRGLARAGSPLSPLPSQPHPPPTRGNSTPLLPTVFRSNAHSSSLYDKSILLKCGWLRSGKGTSTAG